MPVGNWDHRDRPSHGAATTGGQLRAVSPMEFVLSLSARRYSNSSKTFVASVKLSGAMLASRRLGIHIKDGIRWKASQQKRLVSLEAR
jgi:hypothetical protein